MTSFLLPDLGEGLQEAEIVSWHVSEGDHVVADQPLVSVETEKAVVEIPSPQAGHVARLLARVGERIKVGAPLIEFESGAHVGSSALVGQLPPAAAGDAAVPPAQRTVPQPASGVRASPAVRNRARELSVDLAAITPTGPDRTITMTDVLAAAAQLPDDTVLRGARRTMAVNMAKAWREVVHATVQDEVDIGAWRAPDDVTVRMIRAVIAACRAEPSLNASFDSAAFALRRNETIDVGIATDRPEGLFVPVLRNAAAGTGEDWRAQIDRFQRGLDDRSLSPAELRGATITLSNFGTIAGRYATLIVVPPQVAIVGVGRVRERRLPLSVTFDHRAITGGMAARFLRAAILDLEKAN